MEKVKLPGIRITKYFLWNRKWSSGGSIYRFGPFLRSRGKWYIKRFRKSNFRPLRKSKLMKELIK